MLFNCAMCQAEIPPPLVRCPQCGSSDMMVGAASPGGARVSVVRPAPSALTIGDTVFRMSGKDDPRYKQGGRFLRHTVKIEFSGKRQQVEYVERIFNKLEGTYTERCYDPKTGVVTFEKHGSIIDESLHGRRGKHRWN